MECFVARRVGVEIRRPKKEIRQLPRSMPGARHESVGTLNREFSLPNRGVDWPVRVIGDLIRIRSAIVSRDEQGEKVRARSSAVASLVASLAANSD
jgi:hypothetical protein